MYSVTYRIILVLFVVLQFVARFIVGAAGHNPPVTTSEYIVMALAAIGFIALTTHAKASDLSIKKRATYLSLALVASGAVAVGYGLISILAEDGFYILPLIIGVLLILLSVAVCRELLRKA